ncbi:MAG: hypothetical protein Q8L55_16275 [Phycisphaerales bacterium]|nr:hypothetical protein [Phycisphaerales bacterium]
MNISSPPITGRPGLGLGVAPVSLDGLRTGAQHDFASMLSQSMAARSGSAATKPTSKMTETEKDQQARQAAEEFVADVFMQPILKQLRSSSIGGELAPPLGPGPGEKQFRSLADTQVARQLVRASNWPLVDTLTRTLRSHRPGQGGASLFTPEALAAAPTLPGSPADISRARAALAAKAKEATK